MNDYKKLLQYSNLLQPIADNILRLAEQVTFTEDRLKLPVSCYYRSSFLHSIFCLPSHLFIVITGVTFFQPDIVCRKKKKKLSGNCCCLSNLIVLRRKGKKIFFFCMCLFKGKLLEISDEIEKGKREEKNLLNI